LGGEARGQGDHHPNGGTQTGNVVPRTAIAPRGPIREDVWNGLLSGRWPPCAQKSFESQAHEGATVARVTSVTRGGKLRFTRGFSRFGGGRLALVWLRGRRRGFLFGGGGFGLLTAGRMARITGFLRLRLFFRFDLRVGQTVGEILDQIFELH